MVTQVKYQVSQATLIALKNAYRHKEQNRTDWVELIRQAAIECGTMPPNACSKNSDSYWNRTIEHLDRHHLGWRGEIIYNAKNGRLIG